MTTKRIFSTLVFGTVLCVAACQSRQTESKKIIENSVKMETVVSNNCAEMSSIVSDSIELVGLVKNLLKWHENDLPLDFMPIRDSLEDGVFSGIDWDIHNKRVKQLSATKFFTEEFLENYHNIAMFLDKELRRNPVRYYVGDMQPYSDGTNIWCNCQDFPSNWENRLMIVNLEINADSASFEWTWYREHRYFIRAQKIDNVWRISYMERFDIKNFTW